MKQIPGLSPDEVGRMPRDDLSDVLRAAVREESQAHHTQRWDHTPHTLYQFVLRPRATVATGVVLDVTWTMTPLSLINTVTKRLADPKTLSYVSTQGDRLLGVGVLFESRTTPVAPHDAVADLIDCSEARMLAGLTVNGSYFSVMRRRGPNEMPTVIVEGGNDDGVVIVQGDIPQALQSLLDPLAEGYAANNA
jgi:hypothetical protein